MKKITVRVPLRADLAGGTLDLWPLYLFHPGSRTVNVAIAYHAECEISSRSDSAIDLILRDTNHHQRYESISELHHDPKAALVARAVEHFKATGVRIVTRTDAPRGSGLGGSSALAVALVRALAEYVDQPVDGDRLIELVRDLETRLLGMPAGVQDYYPPVYGGLASLHLNPGKIDRHPIALPLHDLAPHFILHYSGTSRFSGTNNWEIYKRHIDGDEDIRQGLGRIAATSGEMDHAIASGDLAAAGAALAKEWEIRKSLIQGISTREIEASVSAALGAGAWGGKVCGAGGGGCIVFLTPAGKREAVVTALASAPGRTVDVGPVAYGLDLEKDDDTQPVFAFVTRRARPMRSSESLEQLYLVTNQSGDYNPYLFAEAAITYDDTARSGVRTAVVRHLVAPLDLHVGRINWMESFSVNPEQLNLTALAAPNRNKMEANDDAIAATAQDAEETLRQFLAERESTTIYHNPVFAVYSEPGETREAFVARCMVEANRALEDAAERLESTFRRRMDQMKERSDREQREHAAEDHAPELIGSEVGIAWGQTLYNITAGKPTRNDAPQSVNEADYLEKIAELQRQWDRELDTKRDELQASAKSIEEITLTPTPRGIEVRRLLMIWAPGWEKKVSRRKPRTNTTRPRTRRSKTSQ